MGEVLKTGDREQPGVLVQGGTVWTPEGPRDADVRVAGESIVEIGDLAPLSGERVIEATGLHVLPGMIDVHVHVDDVIAGRTLADTFPTATELALRTGITTLAGFVTQRPGETLSGALERCRARARGRTHCDVRFHLTPTVWPWPWEETEALVAAGCTTFKLYTTYREAGLFTSYERLAVVMERLAPLGARLLVHCEDDEVLRAADASALDPGDAHEHARLRPEAAEVAAVERVLDLAARSACPVHVVHVSTADAVARIAAARSHAAVTCETAPHYLVLSDAALAGRNGHRFVCTPPLRAVATRARLEADAAGGAFDLFATDHCAFTRADKDARRDDFRAVPSGVAGVGALVPTLFETLVTRHHLGLGELATRLAANPAKLLGIYPRKGALAVGSDADLVVVDPAGPQRPVVSTLADAYETYPGRTTTWNVRHVLLRGEAVVADGANVESARPLGQMLA
ncbi:MAG: amidohydrolase family protein [Thermoanaerobaculaceae bacterium]|nr:amidohydrolase family protein [Thermoanaerobaculaceae bacterium]